MAVRIYPERIYCFPRKMHCTYEYAEWSPGFSWHEFAAGILTANRDNFQALTQYGIEQQFALVNLK